MYDDDELDTHTDADSELEGIDGDADGEADGQDASDEIEGIHDIQFGASIDVEGQTESGDPVAWSTSTNEYYNKRTWEPVEPV